MKTITVGVSNKHAHLTREQIDVLFGQGYQLTFLRNIKQPDEFVSNETISVEGPKGTLHGIRVMGPERAKAQVELTLTSSISIGVDSAVRISANVENTPAIKLIGPKGVYLLKEGVIAAMRHLHMNPKEAEELHLSEGQQVMIESEGARGLIFKNVVVRIDPMYSLEFHIDTDEANGAGLKTGDQVRLINGIL